MSPRLQHPWKRLSQAARVQVFAGSSPRHGKTCVIGAKHALTSGIARARNVKLSDHTVRGAQEAVIQIPCVNVPAEDLPKPVDATPEGSLIARVGARSRGTGAWSVESGESAVTWEKWLPLILS